MLRLPITSEIVGHLASLHLGGICFETTELTLEAKNTLYGTLMTLLAVDKSLGN